MQNASEEYRQAVQLAADAAGGITSTVERMHGAFARRHFAAFGAPAAPARGLHDVISTIVYSSIKAGLTAGGAVAATAAAVYGRTQPHGSLLDTPAGRTAAGMIGGAFGDKVSSHATDMAIRYDGHLVEPESISSAVFEPSGHIVVFLHGLIETERWWFPRDGSPDFGSRLAADLGCTPVYVRYNTGKHISVNGRELDELVGRLVASWPVPVEKISIVGHSMGGLVARSAAHHAAEANHPWADALAHVICLGTPHTGAPLEAGAHALSWTLRRFAETAPLGDLLDSRSAGIKDLRFGYLHEDEWRSDTDWPFRRSEKSETRLPDGARQHFFSATISADPQSPLGRIVGDILVTPDSASDLSQAASRKYAGGMTHFDLLQHDAVYQQIRTWLTKPSRPTPGALDAPARKSRRVADGFADQVVDQPKPRWRDRIRRKRRG